MSTLMKTLIGTTAAGAMALGSAGAAQAQSRYERDRHDHDGISAGEVIAGAVVVGGLAALAAASRDERYGRGNYGGNPRQAVEQCVYAASRDAGRASYRGNAHVTDIRDIDRTRDGYVVKGRIAVNSLGRGWRNGDIRYGRGWDNDYRGWNEQYRGYDAGKFTCRVQYGRIVELKFSGIRGL